MTTKMLKKHIRDGKYAWPGGYPKYFICSDGEALSYDAVLENYKEILYAVRHSDSSGWHVVGCDINWEDEYLYCAHTGEKIECAYSD